LCATPNVMSKQNSELEKLHTFKKLAEVCGYTMPDSEFQFTIQVSKLIRAIDDWFDESIPLPDTAERAQTALVMLEFLTSGTKLDNLTQSIEVELEQFELHDFSMLQDGQKKYFILCAKELFELDEQLRSTQSVNEYITLRKLHARKIVDVLFKSRDLYFQLNQSQASFLAIANFMMICANLTNSLVDKKQDLQRVQRPKNSLYTTQLTLSIINQLLQVMYLGEDMFYLAKFVFRLARKT
jgi:hypothetical protein